MITSSVTHNGHRYRQFLAISKYLSQMCKYLITSEAILPCITNSILTCLPSVISSGGIQNSAWNNFYIFWHLEEGRCQRHNLSETLLKTRTPSRSCCPLDHVALLPLQNYLLLKEMLRRRETTVNNTTGENSLNTPKKQVFCARRK